MALYLDSADLDDARQARAMGGIRGITTNPTLLAAVDDVPERLGALAALGFERVYYQLRAVDEDALERELQHARQLLGSALVLKLPADAPGLARCARLSRRYSCCVTAVYSAAQALRAEACGAQEVAVYVNRATRQLGDGLGLVRQIADTLSRGPTRILAASLKTPEEAAAAIRAGAHDLTTTLPVLQAMSEHPASRAALDHFDREGRGLDDPA